MEYISRPYMLTCTNIVNKKKGEVEQSYQPAVFASEVEQLIPELMKYMTETYPVSVVVKVSKVGWEKGKDGIMQEKNVLIAKQNIIKRVINKTKKKSKNKENESKED